MTTTTSLPVTPTTMNNATTVKNGFLPDDRRSTARVSESDSSSRKLNALTRFYVYALHGLAVEILFTATWELLENGNRKLHGITSIYAIFIYGLSLMFVEYLYSQLKDTLPWYFRGLIYLIWSYIWEFSSGLFLRQFDACPWDYELFFYGHFMGLITLEYAPLWYMANVFGEQVVIKNVLRLSWPSHEKHD